jgi:hypothetical protein
MAKTLHERYCAGLTAMGMSRIPSRNKFTMFTHGDRFYFVGVSGALRVNTRAAAASSWPCSDTFKQRVLDNASKE